MAAIGDIHMAGDVLTGAAVTVTDIAVATDTAAAMDTVEARPTEGMGRNICAVHPVMLVDPLSAAAMVPIAAADSVMAAAFEAAVDSTAAAGIAEVTAKLLCQQRYLGAH
jgi:hypothetical protein